MKAWWGLSASALSLLIIVFAYLAMVAGLPTVERLSRDEAVAGIDVPVIGTVGDYPDPQHRHVISVFADGRIVVNGKSPKTYGELCKSLNDFADMSIGKPIPGTKRYLSGESFVIRADRSSAIGHTIIAMQACSEARADRIFLAVRHEGDGAEGALALWLPMDKGCESGPDRYTTSIVLVPGPSAADPGAGWLQISSSPSTATGRMDVSLDASLEASLGDALAWVDAIHRGGANFDYFGMSRPPKLNDPMLPKLTVATALSAKWTGSRFRPGSSLDLTTAPVGEMPPVARVRGGFAGTFEKIENR